MALSYGGDINSTKPSEEGINHKHDWGEWTGYSYKCTCGAVLTGFECPTDNEGITARTDSSVSEQR